jgi:dTDP-4-dehydrorhamnose reductase
MEGGILITGVHGQLGRAVAAACRIRRLEYEGRDIDSLDIRDQRDVDQWVVNARPATVINCAAFTAVDDCETNQETALAVNATAVGHLAEACQKIGAKLVQISTDYVFAGDGDQPYTEDSPVAPASAYGRTKLRGEEKARMAEEHLVVRTAWLYGHGSQNFVEAIRSQIDRGADTLKVVADQKGCPTYCDDLAHALLDLVDAGAHGTVHAVNAGHTTWHGFAEEIVKCLRARVDVRPVTTSEYPRPADRPAYSVLDTSLLEEILGRSMPPWDEALARYLGQP